MKNLIGLFVLILASVVVYAQSLAVPSRGQDDFEKMTFEAELGKNNYFMYEPIFAAGFSITGEFQW